MSGIKHGNTTFTLQTKHKIINKISNGEKLENHATFYGMSGLGFAVGPPYIMTYKQIEIKF